MQHDGGELAALWLRCLTFVSRLESLWLIVSLSGLIPGAQFSRTPGPQAVPTLLSSHPIPSLSRSQCWPLCVPLPLPHNSRVGLVRAQLEEEQEGDNLCVPFTKVCLTVTIFLSQSVRDRIVYLQIFSKQVRLECTGHCSSDTSVLPHECNRGADLVGGGVTAVWGGSTWIVWGSLREFGRRERASWTPPPPQPCLGLEDMGLSFQLLFSQLPPFPKS